MNRIKEKVKLWWDGTYTPYDNPPDSTTIFIGFDHQRHWTSRACHAVVDFIAAEWREIIGISIGLIGLYLAYLTLA